MSKYVYLTKAERDEFMSIYYSAKNFKSMVSERYNKYSLGLPSRVTLLFWCCNVIIDVITCYISVCNEIYGKSLYRRLY